MPGKQTIAARPLADLGLTFEGFNLLFQCLVLLLEGLDFAAPEERTDAVGDLGGSRYG